MTSHVQCIFYVKSMTNIPISFLKTIYAQIWCKFFQKLRRTMAILELTLVWPWTNSKFERGNLPIESLD